MKRTIHFLLPALAAFGLFVAAQPVLAAKARLVAITEASEALASSVTLPTAAGGTLVMPACAGCAPRSFQTTAETQFELNGQPVDITALRAAMLKSPKSIVTVSYVLKSGVVTQISAAP